MKHNNTHLIFAALVTISITGCYNPIDSLLPTHKPKKVKRVIHKKPKRVVVHYEAPTAEKSAKFQETMKKVALSTQDDNKYHKMALDTPVKKAWFKNLMYRLWDRQITRGQFIAEGLAKYPTKRYEFSFVADGFQNRS